MAGIGALAPLVTGGQEEIRQGAPSGQVLRRDAGHNLNRRARRIETGSGKVMQLDDPGQHQRRNSLGGPLEAVPHHSGQRFLQRRAQRLALRANAQMPEPLVPFGQQIFKHGRQRAIVIVQVQEEPLDGLARTPGACEMPERVPRGFPIEFARVFGNRRHATGTRHPGHALHDPGTE